MEECHFYSSDEISDASSWIVSLFEDEVEKLFDNGLPLPQLSDVKLVKPTMKVRSEHNRLSRRTIVQVYDGALLIATNIKIEEKIVEDALEVFVGSIR